MGAAGHRQRPDSGASGGESWRRRRHAAPQWDGIRAVRAGERRRRPAHAATADPETSAGTGGRRTRSARSIPLAPPSGSGDGCRTFCRPWPGRSWSAAWRGVIGLFLIVAWVLRRGLPRVGGLLPREVVEVLGRAPLADRKQMQLLRLGNKLVLIAVSPTGTDTLAEITDPVEVDRLTGYCYQGHPNSSTVAFHKVFKSFETPPKRKAARVPGGSVTPSSTAWTSTILPGVRPCALNTMPASNLLRRSAVACACRLRLALGTGLLWVAAPGTRWAEEANGPASLDSFAARRAGALDESGRIELDAAGAAADDGDQPGPGRAVDDDLLRADHRRAGTAAAGLGTQQLPPSQVITSITLFLTLLVMSPVWKQVYDDGIEPYTARTDRAGRGLDRRRRVRCGSS